MNNFANPIFQGCGLTMITGACTAINPIDFTLWTSIVLVFGMMIGILISSLCRFFRSRKNGGYEDDCRCCQGIKAGAAVVAGYYKALEMAEESICPRRLQIKRVSPEKEEWNLAFLWRFFTIILVQFSYPVIPFYIFRAFSITQRLKINATQPLLWT